jgi:large repetitive protein
MTPVPSVSSVRSAHIFKLINSKPIDSFRGTLKAVKIGASALLFPLLLVLFAAGAQAQATFGLQPVGSASAAQSVTVTASAAGTLATVKVLFMGAPSLDFTAGSGASTCSAGLSLSVGSTCVQSVTFTPATPGLRQGAVVLVDGNGNVLATTLISGTGQGGLGVLVPGNVIPVAGTLLTWQQVLDGSQATQADLDLPSSVTLDGLGNMYIADSAHHRIRMVCGGIAATISGTGNLCSPAQAGVINTIAGNGNADYTGDGQLAAKSTLNTPSGVTLDGAGNLYIADSGNNALRVVWATNGIISTIAGTGTQGSTGDGGPAASATLNQPLGVTVDPKGDIFIADTFNHRIRMICAVAPGTILNGTACPAAGDIVTVAGDGFTQGNGSGGFSGDLGSATQAELNFPYAVAFDAAGNMYIPDQLNDRVRMVNASGTINTFAGVGSAGYAGDGAAANKAQLWAPEGVAVDAAGNIYIADSQNSAIRKVSSATGFISTLAITKIGEYILPNSNPSQVDIYSPTGLFLDGWGNLYFADYFNQLIQKVQGNASVLDFTATPVRQGEQSVPQNQTIENDGNQPWAPTAITPDQNATVNEAGTTCDVGTPLAEDAQCVISAEFSPSVSVPVPPSGPEFGNIDVASVAINSPLDIILVGIATPLNSTTVVVTSSLNPSTLGTSVTFTATVSTGAGTGPLDGTVTFFVNGVAISGGPIGVDANGVATYTTSTLPVGVQNITAQYMDTNGAHLESPISASLAQTVIQGTGVTLISSVNPSAVGQSVTLTATVSSAITGGVTPDGTVTFMDGSTILGTITLNGQGIATYTTSTLANGLHPITATYNGDAQRQIASSTSNTVNQDVLVPSTVVLTSSVNPSIFGNSVIFTAVVTSSATQPPTGVVNFLNGAQQIGTANLAAGQAVFTTSSLPAGQQSITAVYVGDTYNGTGTSNAISQLVKMAATATALGASPTPAIAGGPIVLTATVTVTQGVSTPTGMVTFTSGAAILGSAAVAASGTSTITVNFPPGSQSIIATYAGDTNDMGSASAPLPLVVQIATTTSTVSSNLNPSVVLSPVTFTVKVTGNGGIPTGTVIFSADGSSIGTGTLDATGSASVSDPNLVVGSHAITAVYSGDANDGPSTSAALNQVVNTIPTATALGTSTTGGATPEVILVATVVGASGPAPTGTVTFQVGNLILGTATVNSSGVAILAPNLPAGSENIVAVYSGDTIHAGSQSPAVSVSNVPLDFTVTVTPPSVTIASSSSATVNVALTSYSGFTDTIGLGCASLPAAVNCHFSTYTEPLVSNGTQTVQLTIDTNNPLGGGTSSSSAPRPGDAKALLAGLSLPLSLFFGCLFWRYRKHHRAVFSTVAVVLFGLASMAVTACSGFTQASAAPGTYVIQVTGTGANSDIVHYQNVSITITK